MRISSTSPQRHRSIRSDTPHRTRGRDRVPLETDLPHAERRSCSPFNPARDADEDQGREHAERRSPLSDRGGRAVLHDWEASGDQRRASCLLCTKVADAACSAAASSKPFFYRSTSPSPRLPSFDRRIPDVSATSHSLRCAIEMGSRWRELRRWRLRVKGS